MTDYVKSTNFTAKDSLPSGDSGKIVRGSEFDTEFNAIASASATKADKSSPTFTGTITGDNLTVTGIFTLGATALTVTGVELNYSDGVTENIQTQLNGKQATLVSGTNIKTVFGTSLVGSGNISFIYPGTGIARSTGSAWTTSLTVPAGDLVGTTATQTLTNKTLTGPVLDGASSTAVVLQGAMKEEVVSLSGTSLTLVPANGTIQVHTLTANTTYGESFDEGESITLMIDDGAGRTVTWPTMTWVGGSEPTLATTGYNIIELWKVGSTLYGVYVGAT